MNTLLSVNYLVAVLIPLAFSGGLLGLPLSIPPLPPDPVINRACPDECLLHLTLAGVATPDGASANLTEQLLAEDEVREFLAAIGNEAMAAARQAMVEDAAATLATALLTRPIALSIERFTPPTGGRPPEVSASLLLRAGDREPAIAEAVASLTGMLAQEPGRQTPIFHEVMLGGATFQQLPTPLGPLSWGLNAGSLIVTFGENSLESLVDRLGDERRRPPAWKTAAEQQLPIDRRATFTYLNATAVIKLAKSFATSGDDRLDAVLDASGLEDLDTVVAASGLDAEGMVADLRLGFSGPPTGVFAPAEAGVGSEQLGQVSADAMLVQTWSLDLSRMLATALDLLDAADPAAAGEARASLERLRAVAGFDIDTHLLRPLGPDWTVVSLPAPGGLLPSVALIAGVRDHATFAKTHKALLNVIRTSLGSGPTAVVINEQPYRGHTLYSLAFDGPVLPVAPCWCLTDDRLLVTLSPQFLKTLLTRSPADDSPAATPEVARALAGGEADLVGVLDPHALLGTLCSLYELATPFARQAAAQAGHELTLPTLPRTTAMTPFVRPSVTVIRHEADAIRISNTATLPLGPLAGGGGTLLGISPSATPVIVSLMLPAVQSAREAARRTQSMNNIKQVLLAMHNYHDVYGRFPPQAICDAAGKPLLSWRVALLPFLERQDLYDRFRRDQPWDSDHNRPLLAEMPSWLADPSGDQATVQAGLTTLQVFTGPDTAFAKPEVGPKVRDITDGLSKTLAVIEVNPDQAVPWTKPADHPFDPANPLAGLGQPRRTSKVFLGGFFDGSVRPIAPDVDSEVFGDLVTPAGREVLPLEY
jgi:hypothetical protein